MANLNFQDIGDLTSVDASGIGKAIIIPAKEALRQLRLAVGGNLTIRDNMYAALIKLGYTGNSTQTLTSGTEYTFQNPLKTTPVGFTPIKCVDANGSALSIGSTTPLNTSRTDGLLGITAEIFTIGGSGDVGGISRITRLRGNNLSMTTNVTVNVCTTASITVQPGDYQVTAMGGFRLGNTNSATEYVIAISKTSSTLPVGDVICVPTSGEVELDWDQPATVVGVTGADVCFSIPPYDVSFSVATQLFLVARSTFTVSAPGVFGSMEIRRMSRINNGVTGIITGILWGG